MWPPGPVWVGGWRISMRDIPVKLANYYQNKSLTQTASLFVRSNWMHFSPLNRQSDWTAALRDYVLLLVLYFPAIPSSPDPAFFREFAVPVDWRSTGKWPWQSQQQQSAPSGRIRALNRERRGLQRDEGGRWARRKAALWSCVLGRLHVLPRRTLKWLHLISMVLITSDREPSVQGSSIKQTIPIWPCRMDWICAQRLWRACTAHPFFTGSTGSIPPCHNYRCLSCTGPNQWGFNTHTHRHTQDKKLLMIQGMKGVVCVPLQSARSNTFPRLQLKEGYAACILKCRQHDALKGTGSCREWSPHKMEWNRRKRGENGGRRGLSRPLRPPPSNPFDMALLTNYTFFQPNNLP